MVTRIPAVARMLTVTWWLQLKMLSASAFNGILQFVWPIFFATTAFLVYRQNGDPGALVYAGLGSAVMGLWSAIATTASGAAPARALARDARAPRRRSDAVRPGPRADHRRR